MVPLVSIMMPAYNAAAYIGKAIESVLAQQFTGWELVIVNDGSTDGTAAVAARYHDPRIRIIEQANAGEAVARNRAMAHMQGQYVAFLDADDLWLPHHLAATTAYLQSQPERDGVYVDGYYCDAQDHKLQPLSAHRRGPFEGWIFPEVVRASDVFGPPLCLLLRRELIDTHQLQFDPAIVIGPDWDFTIAYSEVASFGHLPERTCLYRVHQTNITRRTGAERRTLSLARCREKAIQRPRFAECPADVRVAVFYDLLINLLGQAPERQQGWIDRPEFAALPIQEQARLLRLMTSRAMAGPYDTERLHAWLQRARRLAPRDLRVVASSLLFTLSPATFRTLLRTKQWFRSDSTQASPFGKLV